MAQKKITDLTLRSSFDATCNIPVDDASQTWRVTGAQLNTFLQSQIRPFIAPTVQRLLSGTAQTYYLEYGFIITAGSATVGATYTHNGITYTVSATVSGATQVVMSGSAAPLASGTLTKASGTGDASLVFSAMAAPRYLRVRMVGGGGGGSGGGLSGGTAGGTITASTATTFGTALLTCNPGESGYANPPNLPTAGGTATAAAPAIIICALKGSDGGGITAASIVNLSPSSLSGGTSPFGGAGGGGSGYGTTVGRAGTPNTGSGGGGGAGSSSSSYAGAPGAAGGYLEVLLVNPAASYNYTIGVGGNGGAAAGGGGGSAGGAGGSGVVLVEAYYQ